jgi:acyl dehydratase
MTTIHYDALAIGDALPEHVAGPITRTTLGLYAGASFDHNPIHIDSDFAKRYGMPDVFAHGMLSMAYLAQLLTAWVPQQQIRRYGVRFISITPIHVRVICTGRVAEKFEAEGEKRVRLEIEASTDKGQKTLVGDAIVALP